MGGANYGTCDFRNSSVQLRANIHKARAGSPKLRALQWAGFRAVGAVVKRVQKIRPTM